MVFKKRSKKEQTPDNEGIMEADVTPKSKGATTTHNLQPEMTEAEKALMQLARELKDEYGSYITPTDVANSPHTVIQSEALVLQAAIYGELRKTNELLQQLLEDN